MAVDDCSRAAYVEELDDERGVTAAGFLERAVAAFAEADVAIERVLTDNGGYYKSANFAAQCRAAGIDHRRTRPYTPRTNGKAERFIGTLAGEWTYGQRYANSRERHQTLPAWLAYYNRQRLHGALNHQPPVSRLPAETTS